MTKNNYELDILINGKSVKEYTKDGKLYIEGRKGTEFSLRIRNNSSKRILAIPSVDGLSVMNGKEASFDSSGYIINGYDSLTIDGWRTSDKEVAKFYFSKQQDSYAAKMDRDGNVGVIGMAVFEEKYNELEELKRTLDELARKSIQPAPYIIEKHIHHDHCNCRKCNPWDITWPYANGSLGTSGSNVANNTYNLSSDFSASASMSSINTVNSSTKSLKQELGTGWGESKRSEVMTVEFERKNSPEVVFEIFYNTREQLELMGIDFNAKPVYVAPQAFPNEYCEPPRK